MIYVKKIWILLAGALLLTACQSEDIVIDEATTPEIVGSDSLMPVHLRFSTVDENEVETRGASLVSGEEPAISDIKMICFNQTGNFLGCYDAVLHPTGPYTGTIDGEVDAHTTKVHFIANHPDLVVSQAANYLRDMRDVIQDKELTIDYSTNDRITYWTYHAEANATLMAEFLNPTVNVEDIHFIRDRVKLEAQAVEQSVLSEANITKIEWMVSNGLEKGYVIPWRTFENNTDFIGTDIDATFYADDGNYNKIKITPYEKNNRNRYVNNTTFTEFTQGSSLFVFEDYNNGTYNGSESELATKPMALVKLIFKVTYGNSDPVYHVIRIIDSDVKPYQLKRNHDFKVKITHLRSTRGAYHTLEEALNSEQFSNDPFANIEPLVPSVSENVKTLTIIGGTSKKLASTDFKTVNGKKRYTVNFTFTQPGTGNTVTGVSDANLICDELAADDPNAQLVGTSPYVTYNTSTGAGSFTIELKDGVTVPAVGQTPLTFRVRVFDKTSKLYRYVLFYVTEGFQYVGTPTMKRVTSNGYNSTYQLDFTLPATYPRGLYPITVVIGTRTLTPITFTDTDGTNYKGSFEVDVESTGTDGWNYPASTSTTNADLWKLNANTWNYVYKFKIVDKPVDDDGNDSTDPKTYRIIFRDSRQSINAGTNANVGLYFQVDNFGPSTQISRYGLADFTNN